MLRFKPELGEELVQGVKLSIKPSVSKRMEDSKEKQLCDPCKFSGKSLAASGFCKKCNGYLCSACVKAHRKGAETKQHAITAIKKSKTADKRTRLKPITHCEEHECILESLCATHDDLCCRECVVQRHQNCPDLVPIQRASAGAREKVNLRTLIKDVETLSNRFKNMRQEEHKGVLSVDAQGKVVDNTVETFRKDVNGILDKLEASVLLKKDEVVKDETSVLQQREKVCDAVIPVLSEIEQQLESDDASVDDQSAYVAAKKTQQKLEKYGEVYDELLDGRGKFTLKFIPNQGLVRMLDSLGSLVVRSTIQPVGNDQGAEGDTSSQLVKVGELDVRSPEDVAIPTITGCTFLEDMRLVLADETNKSIKVLDAEGELISTFKTNSAPWDLVAMSDIEVAFRSSFTDQEGDENKIQIISISPESAIKVEGSFSVDGRPKAIRYFHPHLLIVCSNGKDAYVTVVDRKGNTIKRIKPKRSIFSQPQYLALNESCDTIYVSDFDKGIIALNTKGEVKFKVLDKEVKEYGGITMDTKGNLYCCAGKPYGIYRVATDDRRLEPLVVWDEGTIDPQAITFNEKNEQFLVTCCNSYKAFLFSYK